MINRGFDWQIFSYDDNGNMLPSSQALYGPYESLDDAVSVIKEKFEEQSIPVGLTVGIINNGKIEEYWISDMQNCDSKFLTKQQLYLKSVTQMPPVDTQDEEVITIGNNTLVSGGSVYQYVLDKIAEIPQGAYWE